MPWFSWSWRPWWPAGASTLPQFVEREFRDFLEYGILAHGFLRIHCNACGRDRLVAFSC